MSGRLRAILAAVIQTVADRRSQLKSIRLQCGDWQRACRTELTFRAYEYGVGLTRNPQWFWMRRLARLPLVREGTHRWRQSRYIAPAIASLATAAVESPFSTVSVPAVVAAIEADGVATGLYLPETWQRDLQAFAQTTPCYGNGKPQWGFFYACRAAAQRDCPQPLLVGHYFNLEQNCAVIQRLIADPVLRAIAADYLKTTPAYLGSQLWWSFAQASSPAEHCQVSQAFHYDLDDYRFLKFFFYLTDVDPWSGPHVMVQGSHRTMKWQHRLLRKRYTDQAIAAAYGSAAIRTLCGSAGYGFVEDTFCFHKGAIPVTRDRLMLQIEFGTQDYGYQHHRVPSHKLKQLPGQTTSVVSQQAVQISGG